MSQVVRSGSKCGYESGDLVTLKDEGGGWHDKCGKEQYKLARCKSIKLCLDKCSPVRQCAAM